MQGRRRSVRARARGALLRAGYGTRPAFLILGAQKAGTTALFDYLRQHQGIVGSRTKEIGYFSPEVFVDWPTHPHHRILCDRDWERPLASRRKRGWYHSHFPLPHRMRGRLAFEATPEYLYVPKAAERIHAYNPRMRLIVLLREPADRAYAAWTMYHNLGSYRPRVYAPRRDTRTFAEAIEAELEELHAGTPKLDPGYVRRGFYARQVERFIELFGAERMLVLDSARLATETTLVVNEVAAFLGLPPLPPREWPRIHVGRYADDPQAVEPTLLLLRRFFTPHNRLLANLVDAPPRWAVPVRQATAPTRART